MKIKEVCARTGLSERAVRFYEERGLLRPETIESNGRDYRQYSEGDIARLREIAALRGTGFSIEQLQNLYLCPEKTGQTLADRLESLRKEEGQAKEALALLLPLSRRSWSGGSELAQAILDRQEFTLAAAEPDFGREDGLEQEEKQALGQAVLERMAQKDRGNRRYRRVAAAAGAVVLLLAGLLGYHFWQGSQCVSLYSTLSGGYFSDRKLIQAEGGEYLMTAQFTIPEGPSFLAVFREDVGNTLYNSLFLDQEYAGVSFTVEIPKREAERLGLLANGMADFSQKVFEQVLPDDGLCMEYLSIVGLQGDYGQSN